MRNPYLLAGWPPDALAWAALIGAIFALAAVLRRRAQLTRIARELPTRTLLIALALAAFCLSLGYVAYYLRGGPRIIDATSYWLEARAISRGYFSFPVPAPTAAFRGRFLITPDNGSTLSVIFPPGYPVLLALGQLLHAPMLIGPLLGAGIVVSTYALCRTLALGEEVARLAALLSVLCAALRYHTADTMSHGLSALLLTASLAAAAHRERKYLVLAGLLLGWLFATRPVTGGVALILCAVLAQGRGIPLVFVSALPGIALFVLYQRSATGSWLGSSQLRYYALADGPPGCFRYGFGPGIGCTFEHGDFVRERLGAGYGLGAALRNTLRRLGVHALDIANAAPMAAAALYGAWHARYTPRIRLLAIGIIVMLLAYTPFYFEGSYPGGGARLIADVLPLEHVLVAWGLVQLKLARFAVPLSLAGFAFHTSYAHRLLAEREGGRPMFEPKVLRDAHVDHGLVFLTTDHGFNLGHVPGERDANRGIVIARRRQDARDFMLWQSLGRPPAYLYKFDPMARNSEPKVEPYLPPESHRLEAEAEWPLLEVESGWAHPDFNPCASNGRTLHIRPTNGTADIQIELSPQRAGVYQVNAGWVRNGPASPEVSLHLDGSPLSVDFRTDGPKQSDCVETVLGMARLSEGQRVRLRLHNAVEVGLDYIDLHPAPGYAAR